MTKATANTFSADVRALAVRMVLDHQGGARLAVGGDLLDCGEDCLYSGGASIVGGQR